MRSLQYPAECPGYAHGTCGIRAAPESRAGAGAQHSEGMGCRAGADELLKWALVGVWWALGAAGQACRWGWMQPPAPLALQVGAAVGLLAAGGGRSGSDCGINL